MSKNLSLFLFIFLLINTSNFSQYKSKLDSSFLSVGEYYDNYLNTYHSIVAAQALSDSSLVYVAQVVAGSGPSVIIKLKNNGEIDSSFALNGKLSYTINGTAPTVLGIEKFNNKLYLSGKVSQNKFVTRITTQGKIDSTFGTNGTTSINYGTPVVDITNSFALDKMGNCYLGARTVNLSTSITQITITKLVNSTGLVDNSFGTLGKASFSLPTGAISSFSDITIDTSQHIIAACCGSNTGNNVVLLVNFNNNGTLNTSFNSTGYKEYTFPSADNFQVATNKLETDGNKIIVVGDYLVGGNPRLFVMKVKHTGSYDSTFATNGILHYSNGTYHCKANENCLTVDSSILIGGAVGYGINSDIALLKINKNGTIDSSFAQNGMFLNRMGTRWETNTAYCLSQYDDGRIFLGGRSTDCDQATCYFTASMSRVIYDTTVTIINDTTLNDTVNHTSINENIQLEEFLLYPNPCKAGNKLSFNSNYNIENIEIYSTQGKLMFSKKINNHNSFQIPTKIKSGLYFIVFKTTNKQIVEKLKVVD